MTRNFILIGHDDFLQKSHQLTIMASHLNPYHTFSSGHVYKQMRMEGIQGKKVIKYKELCFSVYIAAAVLPVSILIMSAFCHVK